FAKHLGALWKQGQSVYLADNGEVSIQPHPNWTFNPRVNSNDAAENLFRAIGFEYFGPVDGHNLQELTRILALLKDRKGPRLLHVYTTKGKGFAPAEADPIGYHAISKINTQVTQTANIASQLEQPKPQKYSDVFGQFLCDQAVLDDRLVAITPAMCEGSGMVKFAQQHPSRFFDVAIAEQHAVTLAAGMACEGLKPVVAIYSTFLQRGYDQLIHDVALQNLDVTFGIDRAGVVGEDGPTHAGAYDYAYLRTVPHLIVMAPKDENECRQMLHTAYQYPGPAAVRYPRGTGPGSVIEQKFTAIEMGKAEILAHLNDSAPQQIALLAFGSMVPHALEAAQQLASQSRGVMVVNMRFVKPLDHALLKQLAPKVGAFITIEEHAIMGGAGSAVNESLQAQNLLKPVLNIGLPDRFLPQATHAQMLHDIGLDVSGIYQQVTCFLTQIAG
ncbi:MAG: 1-deoxy-D-xylulose-5-phosphate synthase, partial [Moraxellaceae bacterium]